MANSKHYGAFAGGFAKSFTEMMKLYLMQQHYEALNKHYAAQEALWANRGLGRNKGLTPAEIAAGESAGRDWDKGGGGGGGAYKGGAAAEAHGQEMSNYLQKNYGLSPAGAGAVVGNAWQESGFASNFKPGGDKGTASGMFQWRGDRQTDARNWMQQNGKDPADWKSHLDYAMHETQRDYPGLYNDLKTGTDANGLTNKFFSTFERGDPHYANMNNRVGMATVAAGAKPTTETAVATAPTKGPNKGKTPTKVASADVPSKSATPEEAETAAPGGGFRIPGEQDQREQVVPPAPAARPVSADPASVGAGTPPTGAPPPGTAIPRDLPSDQGPGPEPAQPPLGTEPPGTQFARPEAPGVGGRGLPPAPAPGPVLGPAPRADTGARPDYSVVSPGPPEARNMPRPGQTDPGGVYAPTSYARDTGARPDLTARSPAVNPNAPAPNAQPVSATRAIPPTPAQDPRFVQVDAPNQNPNARGQARQTTAIDLSHLWGPNPPVSQATPASAPTPPPVRPQDFSDTPNLTDADFQGLTDAQVMGSAKGGPITRRVSLAKGGALPSRPTMNLAAGGASSAYPSYTPAAPVAPKYGISGNTLAADQFMTGLPGMSAVDLTQNVPGYYTSYGPGQGGIGGQTLTQDWSRMTPDQQKQYSAMVAGTWQPPAATPAAAPAAVAAPAPAPVLTPPSVQNITTYQGTPTDPSGVTTIDPTSTTTTGTPGVPTTGLQAATYDPNKIATTGTGSATDSTGGTDYTTDPNDNTKQILSAKGGAIPPLPTTRFAGAGAVSPNPVIAAMYAGTYNGPSSGGNWVGSTPYSALAPNQQAWADQQKNVWSQINAGGAQDAAYWGGGGRAPTGPVDTSQYLGQLSMMPDAVWPTAAPAAPTPIAQPAPTAQSIVDPSANLQSTIQTIDPTSTTTTGTPGVPTTGLQAKTYDPNNIATTGTGSATDNTGSTNYSTDPKDNTTQILSRKGGPITRRVTRRYDDGGGVSPSIAGPPPGMGGGQQAIPPIYYNPATYSAAGAPVGKGVTAPSSVTYGAGAIPSLPMARGGVVGFDDGGDVSAGDTSPDYNEERQTAGDDQMTTALLDQRDAAANAPPTMAQDGLYTPADYQPSAQGGSTQGGPSSSSVSPITPEISDGQGNPSKGLIGAISSGLHWLGDHLGIGGAQAAQPAIASDPQTQDKRQGFARGQNVGDMDASTHTEIANTIDPNHSLNDAERQIAVMEGTYRYMLSQGNSAGAGRMAASIMQYAVQTSQRYAEEAAKQLYDGNLQGAVDNINHASDAVPDGRLTHVSLNKDGTAIVTAKGMDGRTLWQHKGSAEAILQYATNRGRTGQMQWDALEEQAGKYDPTFKDMAANRAKNVYAQGQEDQITAANNKFAPHTQPAIERYPSVREVTPGASTTTASNPPSNPSSNNATPTTPGIPSSPVAPLAVAEANRGGQPLVDTSSPNAAIRPPVENAGPTVANATGPTRMAAANDPNAPAPDTQQVSGETDFNTIAASLDHAEDTGRQQIALEGQNRFKGDYWELPDQSLITNKADQAAFNDRFKEVQAHNTQVKAEETNYISAGQKSFSDRINERRQALAASQASSREDRRTAAQITAARQLQVDKAALDEHNADYADQIKRAEPRNAKDVSEELAAEDPRMTLARAYLPDQQGVADGNSAGTALAKAGFDAGAQAAITQAYHSGFQRSPLTSKEEVAAGVMQMAGGKQGKATIDKRTGDYNVSVAGDNGAIYAFTLPANAFNNLVGIGNKMGYAAETRKAIASAPPPEARPSTVAPGAIPRSASSDVSGPGWYARHRPGMPSLPPPQ